MNPIPIIGIPFIIGMSFFLLYTVELHFSPEPEDPEIIKELKQFHRMNGYVLIIVFIIATMFITAIGSYLWEKPEKNENPNKGKHDILN